MQQRLSFSWEKKNTWTFSFLWTFGFFQGGFSAKLIHLSPGWKRKLWTFQVDLCGSLSTLPDPPQAVISWKSVPEASVFSAAPLPSFSLIQPAASVFVWQELDCENTNGRPPAVDVSLADASEDPAVMVILLSVPSWEELPLISESHWTLVMELATTEQDFLSFYMLIYNWVQSRDWKMFFFFF